MKYDRNHILNTFKKEEMLDLNETNVKRIMQYCLATKETPKEKIRVFTFFSDECNVNIPKMPFDDDRLMEKRNTILYMLGQFANLHNGKNIMYVSDGFKKYDGTTWTTDKMALFSLYYLGAATQNFPKFTTSDVPNLFDTLLTKKPFLKPTLSPNDPHFDF